MILKDGLDQITRYGAVFIESQMVLLTVQHTDIDAFVVGIPGDGGQVLFHGFTRLDGEILARGHVIDVQGHLMAGHAGHGILNRFGRSDALGDIHQRVIGHHAFIHGIVGQL